MICGVNRLSLALVFFAAGCSSIPPAALQSVPRTAHFAYATGKFDPKLSARTPSVGLGAVGGAVGGASSCAIPGVGPDPFTGLIFLVCAPFGLAIGAVAGASKTSNSNRQFDAIEPSMASTALKALDLQTLLSLEVASYAKKNGINGLRELRDKGPISATDHPRYDAGPDYVIELAVTNVGPESPSALHLPYAFVVSAVGRLVRVADNSVVDSFSRSIRTDSRRLDQWRVEDLRAELHRVTRLLAQSYIDEWLLIYRGEDLYAQPSSLYVRPSASNSGATEARSISIPEYVLHPREWPIETQYGPPRPAPVEVESDSPVLYWEKLPPAIPAALFSSPNPRARNLVYDVRVFSVAAGLAAWATVGADSVVRQYEDLSEPTVRIQPSLHSCSRYYWTVRARFDLDGRPRHTEWSGMFNMMDSPDPQRIRRGGSVPGNIQHTAFYFPFRTPGDPCGVSPRDVVRYPKGRPK